MKKFFLLMFFASPLFAGVQVQQGDAILTSTLTINGAGIVFPNGSTQNTAAVAGASNLAVLGGGVLKSSPTAAIDFEGSAVSVSASSGTATVTINNGITALTAGPGLVGGGSSGTVTLSAFGISLSTQTTGILPVANGGTGSNSPSLIQGANIGVVGSFPNQTVGISGVIPVANGGTGSASPSLIPGTNVTISGSWPNQTINSTSQGSSSGLTYSSFSATNPIIYNNTTGAFTLAAISLSTAVTGSLPGASVSGNIAGNAANITGNLPATQIAAGSLPATVIASSITLGAMYGSPTLNGANITNIQGAQVGSGIPAANIAAGNLGASVVASSIAVGAVPLTGPQVSGILPVANGGSGTASPGLIAGSNILSITGAWPNQTINAATQAGGGGGSSSLAVFNNNVLVSSPTSGIVTDGVTLTAILKGAATGFFSVNTASITAQGNAYSIAGIAASTGTLTTSVNALGVSTGTLLSAINAVGVDTGTLRTSVNNIATSTTTLGTSIASISVATGTLVVQLNNVATSTTTLATSIGTLGNNVAISTTTLETQINTKINFSSITASQPAFWNNGTGVISVTGVSLSSGVVGLLPVANGGTGLASPGLVAGTNITSITGSWPNQTINATTQGGSGSSVYPATATASFPFGASFSSAAFTGAGNGQFSNDGVNFYQFVGSSATATAGHLALFSSSWSVVDGGIPSAGGGTPASPNYSVQVDSNGAFGGSSNFTYDGSSLTLANVSVTTFTNVSSFTVSGAYFDVSASTTNLGRLLLNGSAGANGQVATSGGPGTISNWTTIPGSGLTYSSFTAQQPIIYNNATGAFSSTLISATTGFTGTLQAAQEPAHTGDVTNTAGALAMTAASTQANIHTFSGAVTHTSSTTFTANVAISSAVMLGGVPGTNGQVFTSAGNGATPTWTTVSGGGGGASLLGVNFNGVSVTSPTAQINFTGSGVSVAAVGSTSTVTINPPSITGINIPLGPYASSINANFQIVITSAVPHCQEIVPPYSVTVSTVTFWQETGLSSHTAIGFYNSAGTKIAQSTATLAGASQQLSIQFTPGVALTGVTKYFLCQSVDATAAFYVASSEASTFGSTMANDGEASTNYHYFTAGNASTTAGATVVMPATIGTRANPSIGIIGYSVH